MSDPKVLAALLASPAKQCVEAWVALAPWDGYDVLAFAAVVLFEPAALAVLSSGDQLAASARLAGVRPLIAKAYRGMIH